ncbi:hypothetical protein B0H14DRAFT_3544168 [Mycena olivaceomarginata]|nr:hypothetical protein B0H14DRAFT_3544168 [Mycena olivaceomarginata]
MPNTEHESLLLVCSGTLLVRAGGTCSAISDLIFELSQVDEGSGGLESAICGYLAFASILVPEIRGNRQQADDISKLNNNRSDDSNINIESKKPVQSKPRPQAVIICDGTQADLAWRGCVGLLRPRRKQSSWCHAGVSALWVSVPVGVSACGRGALPAWGARRLERDIVVRMGVGALWAWGECRGENGTTRQTDGKYDGDGPDEGINKLQPKLPIRRLASQKRVRSPGRRLDGSGRPRTAERDRAKRPQVGWLLVFASWLFGGGAGGGGGGRGSMEDSRAMGGGGSGWGAWCGIAVRSSSIRQRAPTIRMCVAESDSSSGVEFGAWTGSQVDGGRRRAGAGDVGGSEGGGENGGDEATRAATTLGRRTWAEVAWCDLARADGRPPFGVVRGLDGGRQRDKEWGGRNEWDEESWGERGKRRNKDSGARWLGGVAWCLSSRSARLSVLVISLARAFCCTEDTTLETGLANARVLRGGGDSATARSESRHRQESSYSLGKDLETPGESRDGGQMKLGVNTYNISLHHSPYIFARSPRMYTSNVLFSTAAQARSRFSWSTVSLSVSGSTAAPVAGAVIGSCTSPSRSARRAALSPARNWGPADGLDWPLVNRLNAYRDQASSVPNRRAST